MTAATSHLRRHVGAVLREKVDEGLLIHQLEVADVTVALHARGGGALHADGRASATVSQSALPIIPIHPHPSLPIIPIHSPSLAANHPDTIPIPRNAHLARQVEHSGVLVVERDHDARGLV